jgi:hypothetical protein
MSRGGGGGDLQAVYTLDDSQLRRGLAGVERAGAAHAQGMERASRGMGASFQRSFLGIGNLGRTTMLGLSASVGMAGKAVNDYARKNDEVMGQLTALREASAKVWTGIGRDISAGGLDNLTAMVTKMGELREGLTDWMADGMGKGGGTYEYDPTTGQTRRTDGAAAVRELRKQQEGQKSESERGRSADALRRSIAAGVRGTGPETLESVRASAAEGRRAREREIQEVEKKGGAGMDTRSLRSLADQEEREKVKKFLREEQEQKEKLYKQDEEAYRRNQEQAATLDRQKAQAAFLLDLDVKSAQVSALRAAGHEKTADLLERELGLRRQVFDIENNALLTAEQRRSALYALRQASALEGAAMGSPSLGTGGGDRGAYSGFNSVLLNPGTGPGAASRVSLSSPKASSSPEQLKLVQLTEHQNQTLMAIRASLERGMPAVLAP